MKIIIFSIFQKISKNHDKNLAHRYLPKIPLVPRTDNGLLGVNFEKTRPITKVYLAKNDMIFEPIGVFFISPLMRSWKVIHRATFESPHLYYRVSILTGCLT